MGADSTYDRIAAWFGEKGEKGEKALLALKIYIHPNITLATRHSSGKKDGAYAKDNISDTILFTDAERSCYQNAPCGTVALTTKLMRSMLELANTYEYSVSEIVGGSHSRRSRHYLGVGIDVNRVGGDAVSAGNKHVSGFMKACRKLGATEVLGPGKPGHATHVHAAWPRSSE